MQKKTILLAKFVHIIWASSSWRLQLNTKTMMLSQIHLAVYSILGDHHFRWIAGTLAENLHWRFSDVRPAAYRTTGPCGALRSKPVTKLKLILFSRLPKIIAKICLNCIESPASRQVQRVIWPAKSRLDRCRLHTAIFNANTSRTVHRDNRFKTEQTICCVSLEFGTGSSYKPVPNNSVIQIFRLEIFQLNDRPSINFEAHSANPPSWV